MPKFYYAAIRHCADGYDWIDTETLSGLLEITQREARKIDAVIPSWAKCNPVTRYAAVSITEINSAGGR